MSDTERNPINKERREFLRGAAMTLPFLYGLRGGSASAQQTGNAALQGGMIIRQKQPENLEFPFSTLDSFLTPNHSFYVRSHFAVPSLDVNTWRLRVEGAVTRPLELTLANLQNMAARTAPATLECAGNSRVFLVPAAKGVQWEAGAVSNAAWTGVPLAAVLERAGVNANAVEVILEGADTGEIADPPKPAGPIHYARSLTLAKALDPNTLLAYGMNGVALPLSHGYPLRAVVPGWYGMASVKWLTRIIVTTTPFTGFHQTIDYAYWDRQNGLPMLRPLTEMQTKSLIARPAMGEVVRANTLYRMNGAAWTGDSEVTKVEISGDGGNGWGEARFLDPPLRFAWRRWEYQWRTPQKPGRYSVMSRATDARGRVQAAKRDPDYGNYAISHTLPIDVEVQ